ncbi:Fe2+-dependent dioxygenase [Amphiplicatus metriothermophilus]|nr:Fe2+-dependent dioxygenase [Amphiplicatus metriothermophilus]MBB5519400.1 PKHD-type hydroxylase [Amphiplicatus metriothermophilus]
MILQIADILDAPTLSAIRETLADETLWTDGAATAKGRARAAKRNLQLRAEAPAAKGALSLLERAILNSRIVRAAAQPDRLARLIVSRYDEGMGYGPHVDAAYIDGARTDVSFTLFLSAPEEYEGGALVIDSAGAEDTIKPPAGAIALYPSTFVHRVEPVTGGRRLAAIGWIKSRVRAAEHRALLFELETALAELGACPVPDSLRDRLVNLRNNLLRAFGE